MAELQPMNPLLYIRDTDSWYTSSMSVNSWYEDEETTVTDPEQVPWLLLQGWAITNQSNPVIDNATGARTQTFKLRRRIIKPEKALQKLINSQTSAYNSGRQLNDMRYDDIVTLWAVLIDKTETELNSLGGDDDEYEDLVDTVLTDIEADYQAYKVASDGIFDDYGVAQLLRINTAFDAKLAEGRSVLLTRGMYNSTIWTDTSSGIERERQFAITDLDDKIADKQQGLNDRLFKARVQVRTDILAARDRLRSYLSKSGEVHTAMRNRLQEAMNAFMERREDTYPDINGIGALATSMGAGSVNHPGA